MSGKTELLPCPFCGGEAHTYKNNLWHVGCERAHNSCVTMSAFATEAEAIAAWNTRHERTCKNENINGYALRFECSACGYWSIVTNCMERMDELPRYCPNCGAKVVGE